MSLLSLLLVAAEGGAAQATTTLSGTVRAQGGGLLEGVSVTFEPGGAEARTDAMGAFTLSAPADQPGTLVFRLDGYMEERFNIGTLSAGETREVGITLSSLYTIDALTVIAPRERPLLNTDDAVTGGTIEREEINYLPTDARNPLTLAFNIPGVSQSTGFFGDAPPLTINGQNSLYTQYLVDGLDNNEGFLGGPRVDFPLAGLSRLAVHANSYSPAFGRSSNGIVDMETKAGGNEWHGEVFYFSRPGSELDADPKFAPAGVDPEGFERNQLGAAIGGPLVRDKTFLFTTVEYSDEQEDRIGSTARAQFVGTEVRRTWKGFLRLDHGWSDSQTTTFRTAASGVEREGQGSGVVVPEADITTYRIGSLTNLTHRSAYNGGRTSNEFSAQLGTFRWFFPPSKSDFSVPQVTIVSPDETTVEAVVGSSNFIFDETEVQFQIKDVFETRLNDRHTLRFGADIIRSSFGLTGASTNPLGAYTVVNEGNINPSGQFLSIDDIPTDVRVLRYTVDANVQQVDLTQTLYSWFVEDEWRVSPSFTLKGGIRWDYDDITSRGESDADLNNFQPRVSANWYANPTTVIRGGWGVYAGKFPYAVFSDAVQFGPDGNAVVTFEGDDFPPPDFLQGPTAEELNELEEELPPREVRRMFARGLEQPVSYQTTLGYQRQIGPSWGLSFDAVWIEARNLPRSWDLNAIDRPLTPIDTVNRGTDFGDPNRPSDPATTGFRRLTTTDSGGEARYLGLYSTVRKTFSDGLLVEGSWVWANSKNDTEDINFNAAFGNDFDAEWADAINDRRHHLTLRTLYEHPSGLKLSGVADFQTGTPINRVAFFRDLDGSGTIFGNGFVGNHDRFPGVARNDERLPNEFVMNGSVAYGIPVSGNKLDVRVEVFNLFNSTVISGFANGIPGGGPRTQTGRPGDEVSYTTAGPPRQFQLSAKYIF